MKDIMIDQFQFTVDDLLVRNKSILDALTKFQDSNARVSRGIVKAVTQCGCIKVNAEKQKFPDNASFEETKDAMQTHVDGVLCSNCRDIIEKDFGRNLFYMASLCNILDLNMYDIIIKEEDRLKILGKFNLR